MNFQKYQATVNHALTSTKRPMHLTSSSIQYFLDNHSDSLKQWILQNFMLKADSMSIDENKIALLIAKESNRSGEELLMLKQEFKKFILNHKKELEMLRSDFSSLVNTNLNGDISVGYIKKLVGDAIKLYDADKTGRADYALETAGELQKLITSSKGFVDVIFKIKHPSILLLLEINIKTKKNGFI